MLKLLRWLNILLVLLTLASFLASWVSPKVFWPLSFFSLPFPWLLLANLLFIIFWALMRKYQAFLSLGCILLGWSHLTGFVGLNLPGDPEGAALVVKTFNAYGFRKEAKTGKRYQAEELPDLFPTEGVDVLCLQEFPTFYPKNYFIDYFKNKAGFKYAYAIPNGALAIFSRYPIVETHTHYFVKHFNGFQWADIKVEGELVRVFNLHLQSNGVSGMANEVAEKGNLNEKKTWGKIRDMAARFKRAEQRRVEQTEAVVESIRKSPHPVLLCGDFNATPQSYSYRQLSEGLKDAFREAGTGFGTTYAGKIPALRIDYQLYSPALNAIDHDICTERLSDHHSVVVHYEWRSTN
ncbi:MAG: endonuclease/exonuclease/phosphatase family protein [Phaeodactylibacter sp.]|uniref:endonuclease/exonuclease/phosphatase family protein n=1 Tax=Phaeodactylibacter sp. TaxID=1940289 RepID=UPI0032EE2A19